MAHAVQPFRPNARPARRGLPLNLHEGWVAGILLALMLSSVTASVATANWTDGLWQAAWAALGGMLFGALVARLRLNGFLAFLLSAVVGTAFVMWLVREMVHAAPDATWNEQVVLIQERVDQWLARVLAGGVGTDAFVFLCIICALGWFVGYIGAWFVFRHHQPWGAILPAGAALLLNLFYAPPQTGAYMMLFLLAALLLLVRTTLLKRQETWATSAIRFANDIGLDFLVYGIIFSGLIILLAWIIPPTAPGPTWFNFIIERARAPWQDFQDDVTRAFSTLRGTNTAAPTTYFGGTLAMGGPIHLGNREVFQVQAPAVAYWRAIVFDQYDGSGWTSTSDQSASFDASDPRMKPLPMTMRRVITETVRVRLPTDNLVIAASQPLQVNQPINAKFMVGRTEQNQSFLDLQSMRLQNPLQLGDEYIVLSSLSAADEPTLRKAATPIPSYIRRTYLDVPASVPERVRALTLQITASAQNDYDKARAIELYLRKHIAYNDAVEPIPPDVDGVDYVLFERREGYCNYYASAMALMARIVGIPARVASGYAVGEPSDDGLYHINESNAHSWPELYFGELGWIEFEPTSGREIQRPPPKSKDDPNQDPFALNKDEMDPGGSGDQRLGDLENQRNQRASLFSLPLPPGMNLGLSVAFVLVGLAVAGTMTVIQLRWQRHLRPLKPAAQAVEEMYRLTRFIGFNERADATPDERAHALAARMPASADAIASINALYVRERYGAHAVSEAEGVEARATGIAVQKRMWRTAYEHYIGQRLRGAQIWVKALPPKLRAEIESLIANRG